MTPHNEKKPAAVSETTKQAGEAWPTRWDWVERSVWTERMLEALERGVKGNVWFSLIDKVCRPATLKAGWLSVKANGGSAGSDHQSIKGFERDLEANLSRLEEELRSGTYRPKLSGEYISISPEARTKGHLVYPQCGTEWCKRRCV